MLVTAVLTASIPYSLTTRISEAAHSPEALGLHTRPAASRAVSFLKKQPALYMLIQEMYS